jgi:hypothetical protein
VNGLDAIRSRSTEYLNIENDYLMPGWYRAPALHG